MPSSGAVSDKCLWEEASGKTTNPLKEISWMAEECLEVTAELLGKEAGKMGV